MEIKIAIADDHPMIIGGLKNLFIDYPNIKLDNAYPDGMSLMHGLEASLPDILLLDIELPDKNGDELAPIIRKKYPKLKVIALTNFNSAMYVYNMLRYGVNGYVLKNSSPEILIKAIETIHFGEEFIDPVLIERLQQFNSKLGKEVGQKPSLTMREKEVLQLIVNGATTKEISEQLFIGIRTIEYYRSNLFLKLEVKNMAALIKKTLELGLVE